MKTKILIKAIFTAVLLVAGSILILGEPNTESLTMTCAIKVLGFVCLYCIKFLIRKEVWEALWD